MPRSGTKATKISKTTKHLVVFVCFVTLVPERNAWRVSVDRILY